MDLEFTPDQEELRTSVRAVLGRECARLFNDWVAKLVKGNENVFLPVAMAPAGCPEAMADELKRCVKELGFRTSHLVPVLYHVISVQSSNHRFGRLPVVRIAGFNYEAAVCGSGGNDLRIFGLLGGVFSGGSDYSVSAGELMWFRP